MRSAATSFFPFDGRSHQANARRQVEWGRLAISVDRVSRPRAGDPPCGAAQRDPGLAGWFASVALGTGLPIVQAWFSRPPSRTVSAYDAFRPGSLLRIDPDNCPFMAIIYDISQATRLPFRCRPNVAVVGRVSRLNLADSSICVGRANAMPRQTTSNLAACRRSPGRKPDGAMPGAVAVGPSAQQQEVSSDSYEKYKITLSPDI